ncbi:abortive infection family protein [Bacillus sp. FSL H8-0547]
MSVLSLIERTKLEKIMGMSSGYVLNFSNRTFQNFIIEHVNREIYEDKYAFEGDSKAKRLRAFWIIESNYIVSKLISALLEYWSMDNQLREITLEKKDQVLFEDCLKIAERLKHNSISEHIEDILQPESDDSDFELLTNTIRNNIEQNQPQVALDRLHTYAIKFVRKMCDKHGIEYDRDKPLQSIFGEYVKFLRNNDLFESEMTERILKSSISILDAFNGVRNHQSFAHDNKVLNYDESMLIFKNVTSTIAFIDSIEQRINKNSTNKNDDNSADIGWDDLPF